MKVIYLAHPYGGKPENLERAMRWVRWVEETQAVAVNANWIIECLVWDDANPEERAAGLARDIANIRRCDEIWAVGGRISDGMKVELAAAGEHGIPMLDLTEAGDEPPIEKINLPPLRWLAKQKGQPSVRPREQRRKRCRRP